MNGETTNTTNITDSNSEQPSRKKRVTKIVFTALVILVILAVIAFTAVSDFSGENVSLSRVVEMIGENWYYLLILLGLFASTIIAEAVKFFIMIRKTTGRYMFGTAFTCAALGKFYDYVTPFGSGGQPFQIYYLSKHGVDGGPAGAIPIGSMFLIQFTFFVCAIVSFIVGVSTEIVPLYIQIIAYFGSFCYISVSLFLVVFSFLPKAGHKVIAWGVKVLTKLRICKNPDKWIAKGNNAIDNNKKNMGIIFHSKRVLIIGTLLSFVFNIAQCSMPYFTLLLFDAVTPSWSLWFDITRVTFFIYCAITIVPTPGNSGAADGTFYGLFSRVLTVAGTCFTGMMIWRVFSFYSYILLGVLVTIIIKIASRVRAKQSSLL
ncbi:MAG: flippase-like domain-containing protein [Clostridiales bacterium]|nr:flippase-like domain-containing protein [Clostridiales bacterium]